MTSSSYEVLTFCVWDDKRLWSFCFCPFFLLTVWIFLIVNIYCLFNCFATFIWSTVCSGAKSPKWDFKCTLSCQCTEQTIILIFKTTKKRFTKPGKSSSQSKQTNKPLTGVTFIKCVKKPFPCPASNQRSTSRGIDLIAVARCTHHHTVLWEAGRGG